MAPFIGLGSAFVLDQMAKITLQNPSFVCFFIYHLSLKSTCWSVSLLPLAISLKYSTTCYRGTSLLPVELHFVCPLPRRARPRSSSMPRKSKGTGPAHRKPPSSFMIFAAVVSV
uniref:Uncharacterized protein n=1 Tax=Nelumbo nucifera TaxID=4432 RepID=A0A823A3T7_NELNU|nr:TPA_asm: hypothetical protein HUJ06_018585 [Nelumbo nucifera]